MRRFIIENAQVVVPNRVLPGHVVVDNGRISAVLPNHQSLEHSEGQEICRVSARGRYVLPGLIDLHSDYWEKHWEPRRKTFLPSEYALTSLEAALMTTGITSIFHGISLSGDQQGPRSNEMAADIIRAFARRSSEPVRPRVRHHIHLRYERSNLSALDMALQCIEENLVSLVSVMDHTPQHGKYRTLDMYRRYVEKTYGLFGKEQDAFIQRQQEEREKSDDSFVGRLTSAALKHNLPLASHDDTSPDDVNALSELGYTISEFPLNEETARAAHARGMDSVVGSPNVVRGESHENNLSASRALMEGWANILCSDYHPPSLLWAVFRLFETGMPLPEAVQTATLAPAKAAHLYDTGSIETGKRADLIIVDHQPGSIPIVTTVMIGGEVVWATGDQI